MGTYEHSPSRSRIRRTAPQLHRPALSTSCSEAVLRTSGIGLDAFCIDRFSDVARRFSGGMTRPAREDILPQTIDADEIVTALRLHGPAKFEKHRHLLTFK